MRKIAVVIPTWNEERANQTRYELHSRATGAPEITQVSYHIVGPGPLPGRGAIEAMHEGAMHVLNADPDFGAVDLLMFVHDDFTMYEEDWDVKLAEFFESPSPYDLPTGLVGFHGAFGLGHSDIYKIPYELSQLARFGPVSNMREAELHGARLTKPTPVATIDGFAMIFTHRAYCSMGGWGRALEEGLHFHNYDNWAACRMRELGYLTQMLPFDCHHQGGGTEVGMAERYEQWAKSKGFASAADVHTESHKILYDRFRDVLPFQI